MVSCCGMISKGKLKMGLMRCFSGISRIFGSGDAGETETIGCRQIHRQLLG